MSKLQRFSLLGRVRAWSGENEVDLGSRQQKAVLAMLLLRAGTVVSMDQLIDGLWGTEPPVSATQTVRTYVHRLRRSLTRPTGSALIRTIGNGYLLEMESGELDLDVVRRQLKKAGSAEPARARDLLRSALARWEDETLVELPGEYARTQRDELARLRLDTMEHVLNLEIQLGASAAVVGEISAVVTAHPLDERFRRLLMLALYHSGRQAQALAVYHDTQALLAEELGVDPGPQLQELQMQILRADLATAVIECQASHPAASGSVGAGPMEIIAPRQLPPRPHGFTGRTAHLAWLDEMLEQASPSAPGVACLHGMAGVGKTALAVHWAHRVSDHFPDGLVHLDLRGFDPVHPPMTVDAALEQLLETLGARSVPSGTRARTALYRRLLVGRRLLLLLDNARDADQLRLLVPAVPGVFVLITSRVQLTALVVREQAQALLVDVLGDEDARSVVLRRLGPRGRDLCSAGLGRIIALCGGLPLALTLVVAQAAFSPGLDLPSGTEPDQGVLDRLSDPDPMIDVRAAFSCSYRYLNPETARVFRLMSVRSGPVAVTTVAGLAERSVPTVRSALRELAVAHLIEPAGPDRFTLHDLLRAYAGELWVTEEGWSAGARKRLTAVSLPDAVGQ